MACYRAAARDRRGRARAVSAPRWFWQGGLRVALTCWFACIFSVPTLSRMDARGGGKVQRNVSMVAGFMLPRPQPQKAGGEDLADLGEPLGGGHQVGVEGVLHGSKRNIVVQRLPRRPRSTGRSRRPNDPRTAASGRAR